MKLSNSILFYYLDFAKEFSYLAGKIMLKYFKENNEINYKLDKTIVTKADTEINELLIEEVKKKFPNHSVDGEESKFGSSKYVWICDPVDGTAMYARHIPVAVFSLALVIDGIPVLGVVYDPFTNNLYSAVKGNGAYINEQLIKVNDIRLGDQGCFSNFDVWPTAEYDLFDVLIKDDLLYLENLEDKLTKLEDQILYSNSYNFNKIIINKKKEILRFYHYYGQLLDMGDTLSHLVNNEKLYLTFKKKVARLQSETLLLREYTHQLQDLYESQISMHQNDVMKIVTTVTTIFLPLTLLTGWYGMNFKYMPEISWVFGYPMVIILFALIIITCIIIFKKKNFW